MNMSRDQFEANYLMDQMLCAEDQSMQESDEQVSNSGYEAIQGSSFSNNNSDEAVHLSKEDVFPTDFTPPSYPLPKIERSSSNGETFCIWNNKGGVGKSTLCFQLSTLYAKNHQDEIVIVIDMCPQANSSMLLLGGCNPHRKPHGRDIVEALSSQQKPKTLFSFLEDSVAQINREQQNVISIGHYLIPPSRYNSHIPSNVYLLAGDQSVNMIDNVLTVSAQTHGMRLTQEQKWLAVHNSLKRGIDLYRHALKDRNIKVNVFLDTNPSFTTYTAIAITAGTKLIVPVKPDDSSRIGVQSMLSLIYGPSNIALSYAAQARRYNLQLPKVHLIIGNQLTQYKKSDKCVISGNNIISSANAFSAIVKEVAKEMYKVYGQTPETNEHQNTSIFSPSNIAIVNNQDQFEQRYLAGMRDYNTLGVLSSHLGNPFCVLSGKQEAFGKKNSLDQSQLASILQQLNYIVESLR